MPPLTENAIETAYDEPVNDTMPTVARVFGLLGVMFDRVDEQLSSATNALVSGDLDLARRVAEIDKQVDSIELQVDQACEELLALGLQTLGHVRRILGATRINAQLERVGDLAKNVAKRVGVVPPAEQWKEQTILLELADAVRHILREAHEAFVREDRLLARKVLAFDRRVDRAWRETHAAVAELCMASPKDAAALVHLVTIGKDLERIADHAKSIARSIIYYVEGTETRHMRNQAATN